MEILIDDKCFRELYNSKSVQCMVSDATQFLESFISSLPDQRKVHVVAVSDGAIPFASHIMSHLIADHNVIGFSTIKSSSYKGVSRGNLTLGVYDGSNVDRKDVVIIEDIIDTGRTIDLIIREMKSNGAASVSVITMLDKSCCREVDLEVLHPDVNIHVCREVDDLFVVGFGLDYNCKGRWLQSIYSYSGDVNTKYED